MKLETDIIKYLPAWYREILDYQQLCLTETEQFEALALALNNTGDNFFFQTADEPTIALWEQVLHIIPNPVTEDLEFRRARVISRISSRPPFTLGFLYRKLDEIIGTGLWEVYVDYPNYSLYIGSSAKNQNYYMELAYTIGRIKPAHIVFVNSPLVQEELVMSETISLTEYRFNYRLGDWQLGALPFGDSIDKGVIKMAETPSIQPELLTAAAGFVLEDIASARINGALTITGLTKTRDGSTVNISYPVRTGDVGAITKVELLDAAGNVLTSSPVYVPVGEAVVLRHRIPIKEGV